MLGDRLLNQYDSFSEEMVLKGTFLANTGGVYLESLNYDK